MSRTDEDYSLVQLGHLAGHTAEMVEAKLQEQEKAVRARIFQKLNSRDGSLDPQAAVQAWIELHAIDALRRKLLQQQRQGQTAGGRIADKM